MKTLRPVLSMILLTGSVAAQVSTTASGAPDVIVLMITWRRVEPINPKLNEARLGTSPDYDARVAINKERIHAANSARQSGADTPPPKLLSVPSIPDSPPSVRPWAGFIYEFTVRNTGAKTVRQVVFEYSFTDPGTQKKVGRRQYKSNVKIRPGSTANLVVRTSLRPIGTIDATQAGQNQQVQSGEQVVIQRIKYADGSVWQRDAK